MIQAVVAVYLNQILGDNSLQLIALGFSTYMISRSLFQVPIALSLDRNKGFFDESFAVFFGSFLGSIALFGFTFVNSGATLVLVQALFGLGMACNIPAWRKIFARFVDKDHEAIEYGIYDMLNNIIIALLTALGGYVMTKYASFDLLFTLGAITTLIGGFIALLLLRETNSR